MHVKQMNPDHQRLVDDLLANPATAMCPICGQRGFWDNRQGKNNPKSPDWKCKNKACVGATPMKRKDPYAVWLPEGYTDAPVPSGNRLSGPADGPPAHHHDSGVPDSPEDLSAAFTPEGVAVAIVAKREIIELAYRWAYDVALRVQTDAYNSVDEASSDAPVPTAESVQAGAATVLIQAEKRGAI